ncbi:MAG: aminotransferase class IV [Prolixibacteraceae bacterium]|nr:aminotransferase class IV [Prolixibacteraceae bacterium]
MNNLIITSQGILQKTDDFTLESKDSQVIYEVLRIIDGIPLFVESHFERLINSFHIKGMQMDMDFSEFKRAIHELVKLNRTAVGNVKFEFAASANESRWAFQFIPHSYPSHHEYQNGVSADLLFAERANPNAKVIQNTVREMTNRMIEELKLYEVLLVDRDGYITEGSRSNVFFIKDEMFYTAPESKVLVGITRQKVIECLRQLNFELVEKSLSAAEISQFDAAFLTGTSPKVLPVRLIGKLGFNTQVSVLQKLMKSYDDKIYTYIEKAKAEDQFC